MKKQILITISLLFLLLQIITLSNVKAVGVTTTSITQTSSTENILNATLIPQKVIYSPIPINGKPVVDIGLFTTLTTLTGFSFNASHSQPLTIGLPSGCISSSIFFNKTITSLQCANFSYFFKLNQYQSNIIINAIGNGLQVCLPITSITKINFNATINPFQINNGNNILDFSDIPLSMNPTFNIQLNELCYNSPIGPYNIDPIAIDGSGSCANGSSNTCNITLTTSNTNVIVIVISTSVSGGGVGAFALPTASGLTFINRAQVCAGFTCASVNALTGISEDYAKSSSALSSEVITITQTGNPSARISGVAYGVSGANFGSPFDPNVSLPCTGNSGSAGTTASCILSTSNANDMIIGSRSAVGTPTSDIYSGITTAAKCNGGDTAGSACSGYVVVSSTQSSLTVSISWTNSGQWTFIGDAIQQASTTVTMPIKISLVGTGSVSIGITNCGVSNSSFTVTHNNYTHTYSGVTASCNITLNNPNPSLHSGNYFDISPHPSGGLSLILTTCASGPTCSTYTNTTYSVQNQNYTATPVSPNVYDAAYVVHTNGTFLGTHNYIITCATTSNGGGVVGCVNVTYNYNVKVCLTSPLGNTWIGTPPTCFTKTTANNALNVNYNQQTGSSILIPTNNDLAIGIIVFTFIICFIGFMIFFRR